MGLLIFFLNLLKKYLVFGEHIKVLEFDNTGSLISFPNTLFYLYDVGVQMCEIISPCLLTINKVFS